MGSTKLRSTKDKYCVINLLLKLELGRFVSLKIPQAAHNIKENQNCQEGFLCSFGLANFTVLLKSVWLARFPCAQRNRKLRGPHSQCL